MTVTVTLSPEEAKAVAEYARALGTDAETALHRLIAPLVRQSERQPQSALSAPQKVGPAALDLSAPQDQVDDPEEMAERERERIEMRNNIDRWRTEQRRP